MQDMLWLIRKTLRSTFRKKSSWVIYFGLPLAGVLLSMLMYGNSSGGDLRVGVVNLEAGKAVADDAVRYVEGLNHVKLTTTDEDDLRKKIAGGDLDAGLIVRQGFADSVREGSPEGLELLSAKGAGATSYVKAMLDSYVGNIAAIGRASGGDAANFDAVYGDYRYGSFAFDADSLKDTSNVKDMTYQSIGYLLMFMMFSAVNLSEIILKEKENRTYLRLLSSPVSARTYVLSNVIVNAFVLLVQIAFMLVFMRYIFHIDSGVTFGELLATLAIFSLTAIGLSLLLVSFAKNSKGAGALQTLVVTPTCLLSGCFFPAGVMPDSIQKISSFTPQHWLLDTITKLQDGQAFGSLYLNFAILLGFAAAFALVAVFRFSRNNDVRQFI